MWKCFLCSAVILILISMEGNCLQVQTKDTKIGFIERNGAPVITDLQYVQKNSHNWAAGTPETVLPKTVTIDGKEQAVKWTYKGTSPKTNQVGFTYECGNPKLTLISTWESTNLPGPVEHSVTITNKSKQTIEFAPPPTIDLTLKVQAGHKLKNWWVEKSAGHLNDAGTHTDVMSPGYEKKLISSPYSEDDKTRDSISWFSIQDAGHGIYGGVEFTGWTQTLVTMKTDKTVGVSMGLHPLDGKTRTRVKPGGTLSLPTCFIGAYTGEVDDGCNRLHRWVENHLRPPMPGGVTPVLVNNSWGSGMAVDELLAKRMIDDCASLGIEVYHVDAGWYKNVGDWRSNPNKLPNGLEKIVDYTHSKGLKFGLWVGWTQGGSQRDAGPDVLSVFNPEQKSWFGSDLPNDWKNWDFTGATVCLGCPDASAWCLNDLRRMVKQYKLDLLEHDQNMVLDNCGREGHDHIPGDRVDTSRASAEGYYSIYEQLLKENPNLLLEDCVNGGRLFDFGVAKRVHYMCISDDYFPLGLRKGFYDMSFPFPPSMLEGYIGTSIGPEATLANFKFMLRSNMMGWCTIMIDTSLWTPAQHVAAKRQFALYKQKLRPLIASANLYHVLPRPDGKIWDGMQYYDPKTGKGVVFIFRPQSDVSTQTVRLMGLDPNMQYSVAAEDGSAVSKIMSGKELMVQGLRISLPERDSSDLIFISLAK